MERVAWVGVTTQPGVCDPCPSPKCYLWRMPLKSATFKKMKLRPRDPGDQNATTLPALVAGEIAIRQAQLTISTYYIKDAGEFPRQKTSRA